jgi:hypothetical protein
MNSHMHLLYLSLYDLRSYALCAATLSQYLTDACSTVADDFFAPGDIFGLSPQQTWLTHPSLHCAAGFSSVIRLPPTSFPVSLTFGVFFAVAECCHSGLPPPPRSAQARRFSLAITSLFHSSHFFDCSSSLQAFLQLLCTFSEGLRGHFETRAEF